MNLVPYVGTRPSPQQSLEVMAYQGVFILIDDEYYQEMLSKIEAWFEERDEIILIQHGEMAKTETSFIILEWEGVYIDPLFLKILEEEQMVEDYTVYERGETE